MRILTAIFLAILLPVLLAAQDDPSDTPLGDIARTLRKKPSSSQEVIDNDNFSKALEDVQSRRPASASALFSIDPGGKSFQLSSPDATCSLAFTASARALLSNQYAQLDLPPEELVKLDGPATIEGDSLQLSIFNGTDWHVSELAVAVTIVKRPETPESSSHGDGPRLVPAAAIDNLQEPDRHPQKRSDTTVLYRMRAAGVPSATTIFRAPMGVEITPDQEWHWAIVQAKGYPPQPSSEQPAQLPAQSSVTATPSAPPQAAQNPLAPGIESQDSAAH
jgi:hypothetical protein